MPTYADPLATAHWTLYQNAKTSKTITVVDAAGAAVDCSGFDLSLILAAETTPGTATAEKKNYNDDTDITVGGSGNNEATVALASTDLTAAGHYRWALRNMSNDGEIIARGTAEIQAYPDATDPA